MSDAEMADNKASSSNRFATGSNQNCGNVITERSSTGLHAPPGGKSSICLGMTGPEASDPKVVSSNRYATGSNQNCGNVLTDRSSTGLHAPPGGKSNICLGMNAQEEAKPASRAVTGGYQHRGDQEGAINDAPKSRGVSANTFAQGSDQNCGNVITDRPTTRLHAPPGGKTSICLGFDSQVEPPKSKAGAIKTDATKADVPKSQTEADTKVPTPARAPAQGGLPLGGTSSNAFAQGSNQNCGNFITDTPTTRVHAPPGGKSSMVLG